MLYGTCQGVRERFCRSFSDHAGKALRSRKCLSASQRLQGEYIEESSVGSAQAALPERKQEKWGAKAPANDP